MTEFNILDTKTDVDTYIDQANVAVTIELDNGNTWYVQTDRNGTFSPQANCEIYLNESNDGDFSDLPEFDFIVNEANKLAKAKLKELY